MNAPQREVKHVKNGAGYVYLHIIEITAILLLAVEIYYN